jgi:hypothetical protein
VKNAKKVGFFNKKLRHAEIFHWYLMDLVGCDSENLAPARHAPEMTHLTREVTWP